MTFPLNENTYLLQDLINKIQNDFFNPLLCNVVKWSDTL